MAKKECDERVLYETKWFDYRPLAPDVATLVFMLEWAVKMREYKDDMGHSRYWNFLRSFKSFDLDYLRTNRRFKTLTKLRQYADKHRIRYDHFWHWAFEAHNELGFTKTFDEVFLNKKILKRVLDTNREYEQAHIKFSQSKLFEADNYDGLQIQKDYYDYIIHEVQKRYPRDRRTQKINSLIRQGKLNEKYFYGMQISKNLI